MKWSTVKEKAKRNAIDKFNQMQYTDAGVILLLRNLRMDGDYRPTWEKFKEALERIQIEIENWDIRGAKSLIEALPLGFPQWMQKGNFTITYGEKGWELNRK